MADTNSERKGICTRLSRGRRRILPRADELLDLALRRGAAFHLRLVASVCI